MQRWLLDELRVEDDIVLDPNGDPCTGIGCSFQAGTLVKEVTHRNGIGWGPSRVWNALGIPTSAIYYVAGVGHGLYREWHPNGWLSEVELVEYGEMVRWRSW